MLYWVQIARQNDKSILHRGRCSEVPSNITATDFWESSWFDYPDKDQALDALELSGTTLQRKCPLCKP